MKYVRYLRKSTDTEDRQVQSLETQERLIMDMVNKEGLTVVGPSFRESMSAKSKGRPVFNKVIEMIKSGEADAILCYKLDRLARNFIDGGEIIDLLQKSVIKEIRTCDGVYRPGDNVLPIAVNFGTANQYVLDLSTKVKDGNKTKLLNGGWPGVAPFGYLNEQVRKTIIINQSTARYVKRMFELYANENKSYGEISDILFSEGLRTKYGNRVYKGTIQKIISSKFYMGIIERDGKLYKGAHEPIISRALFDKAQQVSDNKSRPRPQNLTFALTGLLKCESCGCVLTASRKRGHDYYYCTNGKKVCDEHKIYMRENYLYEEVGDILSNLAFSPRKVEIMYKATQERLGHEVTYSEKILDTLQKELESLTVKESRLFDIYLDGDILKAMYDEKLLEIKNRKLELGVEISKQKNNNPLVTLEQIKNVFLQGITIRNEFLKADNEQKKKILQKVLWNISFKDRKSVAVQYKSPYNILANAPKNLTILEGLGYKDSNLN